MQRKYIERIISWDFWSVDEGRRDRKSDSDQTTLLGKNWGLLKPLGPSQHLYAGLEGGPLIGPPLWRETPVSRTAIRSITAIFLIRKDTLRKKHIFTFIYLCLLFGRGWIKYFYFWHPMNISRLLLLFDKNFKDV